MLQKSVILIGHRGAGKTTAAELLAQRLRAKLVDVDRAVQCDSGQSIAQLFCDQGEASFRLQEKAIIARLQETSPAVISVGAGAVEDAENRAHLKASGVVVWLQAGAAERALRLAADPTTAAARPALADSPGALGARAGLREDLYRQLADLTVDTTQLTPQRVCARLLDLLGLEKDA